tara:strand:+ start:3851 stop:4672 length:822 start_codon:yes stop_codon:yes gene_type:complete
MYSIISTLKSSTKLLKEHKPLVLLSASIDLLFLFVYGFVFSMVFSKIEGYLLELYNLMMEYSQQIQGSLLEKGLFSALRATPEMSEVFNELIIWFLVLGIVIYVLYSVFQGISWRISYKIIGKKIGYSKFLIRFGLVNLFWFAFYIIYQIIDYLFDLNAMIAVNMDLGQSAPGLSFISFMVWISMFVIGYFVLISYTLVMKHRVIRKSFGLGFRKLKVLLPAYLTVLAVFFTLNLLLVLSFRISPVLMFIVGIIGVFPAITWARVFFNLSVNE